MCCVKGIVKEKQLKLMAFSGLEIAFTFLLGCANTVPDVVVPDPSCSSS